MKLKQKKSNYTYIHNHCNHYNLELTFNSVLLLHCLTIESSKLLGALLPVSGYIHKCKKNFYGDDDEGSDGGYTHYSH